MKKIEATIEPFALDPVRDGLLAAGAEGMSVTEVKVLDLHARARYYRGTMYEIQFASRCRVEVVVPDDRAARCVDAVRAHAGGAAEIVVQTLDESVHIRTGEHRLSHAA